MGTLFPCLVWIDLEQKMWLTPEIKEDLTLWKNPRDSGIVFGFVLVFLLGIRYVSIISVLANMSLALITSTMAFRIYKSVLSVLNKTQDGHPFKHYLAIDVTLPVDQVLVFIGDITRHLNLVIRAAKSAIMLKDMMKSAKFAFAMYALTYIGKMFNGLTLVIAIWVFIFTGPKIYKDNQIQIDEALKPIKEKIDELMMKMKATTTTKQD